MRESRRAQELLDAVRAAARRAEELGVEAACRAQATYTEPAQRCPICRLRFAVPRDTREHLVEQHKACPTCWVGAETVDDMRRHMREAHPEPHPGKKSGME